MRSPLVESWEHEAAGLSEDERLSPTSGLVLGLAIGVPVDLLLLLWVMP